MKLVKCDFCNEMRPVVIRVQSKHKKSQSTCSLKKCLDCHTKDEVSDKKNYGTHKSRHGIFD